MDLYLLSYLIQQRRYRVDPRLVADAILRWHLRPPDGEEVSPRALELGQPADDDPERPRPYARS